MSYSYDRTAAILDVKEQALIDDMAAIAGRSGWIAMWNNRQSQKDHKTVERLVAKGLVEKKDPSIRPHATKAKRGYLYDYRLTPAGKALAAPVSR